ncbi:hypothetical protein [Cupriavidus basilensis]|uniref:hypothetical protein n=1 Tax=Cupriavidus basilensis TaxID=68895 RepID=UPI001146EA50|nr:hypothetical protein [Cupriavidus basilensis]
MRIAIYSIAMQLIQGFYLNGRERAPACTNAGAFVVHGWPEWGVGWEAAARGAASRYPIAAATQLAPAPAALTGYAGVYQADKSASFTFAAQDGKRSGVVLHVSGMARLRRVP